MLHSVARPVYHTGLLGRGLSVTLAELQRCSFSGRLYAAVIRLNDPMSARAGGWTMRHLLNFTHPIGGTSVLSLGLVALFGLGCVSLDLPGTRRGELEETVVFESKGPDAKKAKILILDIDGEIMASERPGFFGAGTESTVARVREQLDRARNDEDLRAVLLRVDSPGGSVTASEQVYHELVLFRQQTGLPIVAQLMGTAASGGYYVAMAADEIQAHQTTVTGSIGVIFFGLNFSGLMEKLGVKDQTLTAGALKDMGSPLRPMKANERAELQSVLDDMHTRFREVVAEGRPKLSADEVVGISDGRIFSAPQALERGLVDGIGTIEEAVALAEKRASIDGAQVVIYHRPREWRRNLYTRSPVGPARTSPPFGAFGSSTIQLDLSSLLGPRGRPGFHYMWWPVAD
jgi:protease-4